MNQVLMVQIGGNGGSRGLFINANLIASTENKNQKADIDMDALEELAKSICVALNVSLVEVNFSETFSSYNWQSIRDILLKRRVMRYRNAH